MIIGKFNVVTDGQWGSCGKGLISSFLANKFRPELLSTTNMSNAGHTAVNVDGEVFVAKALPASSVLNRWYSNYNPTIVVGPSAAFDIDQMLFEIDHCKLMNDQVIIHPRSGVILDCHKHVENGIDGTKGIASTMQGCGAFLADKIMRRVGLKLSIDYQELQPFTNWMCNNNSEFNGGLLLPCYLLNLLNKGKTILHEGSQGFSLDINHGSHYPHCTSRGTTAIQNAADMGINHHMIGDIYLVVRPYPIRVGNIVEKGSIIGYSGGCYSDQQEISWDDVASGAGAPKHVTKGELTTVTKRLRRVFSFSNTQFMNAINVNGATKIALNFANYIDWSCYGTNDYGALPSKVMSFIANLEDMSGVPVNIVGTGPQIDHVCFK